LAKRTKKKGTVGEDVSDGRLARFLVRLAIDEEFCAKYAANPAAILATVRIPAISKEAILADKGGLVVDRLVLSNQSSGGARAKRAAKFAAVRAKAKQAAK
jgi:hypothetical protein